MKKRVFFNKFRGVFGFVFTISLLGSVFTASAQNALVSIKMENAPISQIMKEIENQTRYLFINEGVNTQDKVSINVDQKTVQDVLAQLFGGTEIDYRFDESYIILTKKSNAEDPLTVTGTIRDTDGIPLVGATVVLKGTTIAASSGADGTFSLRVPPPAADKQLEIIYLGYEPLVVGIGSRTSFDLTLQEASLEIEEVVVTALGIKRSEKAVAYNVQQVKAEEITTVKNANFINSLTGKVAGVIINASSSGVGGASKVVMRGQKSIIQSSNALYVIDGVPMYAAASEGSTEMGSRGSMDPIADLNPEDIESMSVLTGAAAAALYGSAAANGAIVINTKKGESGKTSVTVASNTEIFNPFILPKFQNRYGSGSPDGKSSFSWGNKLNSFNFMGYDPRSDYFQTGVTGTESVSVSTGNAKNQTYFSAAAVNSKGNIPNNKYSRYNFMFRNTSKFLKEKMTLDVSANYIMQRDLNTINQGTYSNPIVGVYLFPRGDDWEDVKMFERWDPSRRIYTQHWTVGNDMDMQNPYWVNYRNLRDSNKKRYMFSAGLSYEILDWLTLSGRVRIDNSSTKYTEKFYATTYLQLAESSNNGLFGIESNDDRQVYADALLDINKTWNDWSIHANIGASITDIRNDIFANRGGIASDNIPNVFNVFAIDQATMVKKQGGWREQTQSVYASAELGYKSAYFLTLTGRNDWPSQLAGPRSKSKSFFYPSVGASVVLSQIIPMPKQIEYLKVRASFASVGASFERWLANPLHSWPDKGNSWQTETVYPMDRLKPEMTTSWEVGLQSRFLNGFSLDVTYYNTHTKNQTFNPEISSGSGYADIYIQSGNVKNEGVELALGFHKTWRNFTWNSNYVFTANKNKIISLADGAINPVTGEPLVIKTLNMGGLGNARFILKEGGSLGDLYSTSDLLRDSNNSIYVDYNGKVATETIKDIDNYIKLGSVLPKSNMSWRNDFRYGNFNFGFMFVARFGGVVFSRTQAVLDYYGVSEATAASRDNGGIMINGGDLIDPYLWYSAIAGGNAVPQYYTYSASNVRLQELTFGYTFPRKMLGNLCELTLQLVGRNLWMVYNRAPFDPESVATTGNYYQGIDYFMTPNTRNFGFNIRLNF